jgi:hypothetical protein
MSNKKALRAQRHLSQSKTIQRVQAESQLEGSEGIEERSSGVKKTTIHKGRKYIIDMEKE